NPSYLLYPIDGPNQVLCLESERMPAKKAGDQPLIFFPFLRRKALLVKLRSSTVFEIMTCVAAVSFWMSISFSPKKGSTTVLDKTKLPSVKSMMAGTDRSDRFLILTRMVSSFIFFADFKLKSKSSR